MGVAFTNYLKGVSPVCQFDSANNSDAAYNLLFSFGANNYGFGTLLSIIFILALAIYFATSSDSGSLIVDHLASNGRTQHHWLQRFFWAVTEGAVATALLSAGGSNALGAVQSLSVIAGLPYVFSLLWLVQSIYVFCEAADKTTSGGYEFPDQPEFSFPLFGGVFNVFEYLVSGGSVNNNRIARDMGMPSGDKFVEFFKGGFLPFVSLYQVLSVAYPRNTMTNIACSAGYAVMFIAWIILFATGTAGSNKVLNAWGWSLFFCVRSFAFIDSQRIPYPFQHPIKCGRGFCGCSFPVAADSVANENSMHRNGSSNRKIG